MADDRARRLTTRAVTVALLLALVCFAAGLALGLPAGSTTARDLTTSLVRGEGRALVTLGVLLLVLAPVVRLLGMVVEFARAGDTRALLATWVMLALLGASFLLPLLDR